MSLKSLLNQTLTHYPSTGYNEFGDPRDGTAVDYPCRFEPEVKRILQPNGNVLITDGMVIVEGTMPALTDERVTFNGVDYKVAERFPVPDDLGNTHHVELKLIKWHKSQ